MKITFRPEELSYKEFTQLTKSDRQKYLELLENMDKEYLSFNDWHILNNYSKKEIIVDKFFEL
jgi:hypothetical protein